MTTFTYMVTLPAEKKLDTHSRPGDGYSQIVARAVSQKRLAMEIARVIPAKAGINFIGITMTLH